MSEGNRPLTPEEFRLAKWMLENGTAEGASYLSQLELAEATPWKCPCGCASFNLQIKGRPAAPPGVHILGDFIFKNGAEKSGAFIFSSQGVLSGLEVYGLSGDAPRVLPRPEDLHPLK